MTKKTLSKRERQNLIFGIIALVGVILILSVGWFYFKQYRFTLYTDPAERFSIKYPHAWTVKTNNKDGGILFGSPKDSAIDDFRENVNIVVQDLSENPLTLEEYTDVAIKQMRAVFLANFLVEKSESTSLGGYPAHQLIFEGRGPGVRVKYRIVWAVKGLKAYQVTYTAFPSGYKKYYWIASRMIRSFRILK